MSAYLVWGASGMVGECVLPILLERGAQVVAMSRHAHAQNSADASVQWRQGDLGAPPPALPPIDVVLSLGPLDAFAAWFARATEHDAGLRPRRVVALSSMSAESKRTSVDADERALSARLRDAEVALLQTALAFGCEGTILRPTLIYGAGRDASLAPLARRARRWRLMPVPRGANGLRQPVHVADLAAACVAVIDVPATFGKRYELGGGECLRFDALLARMACGPPRIAVAVPVPLMLIRLFAQWWPHRIGAGALARMTQPLLADNAPASRDFGYAPRRFEAGQVLRD